MTDHLQSMLNSIIADDPITETWLRLRDFKIVRDDPQSRNWRLTLDYKLCEDLYIEVSANRYRSDGSTDWWFCWVGRQEPGRSVHVRHIDGTQDLERLYQGLTGQPMPGPCTCSWMKHRLDSIARGEDPNKIYYPDGQRNDPNCEWHKQ